MKTIEIEIPEMSCGHCVQTVQSALAAVSRAVVHIFPCPIDALPSEI